MADDTKREMSPSQCRAARGLLNWSQEDLAKASEVSRKTIAEFEREARTPQPRTLRDLRGALEQGGVEFINPNGGGAGVRLKRDPE